MISLPAMLIIIGLLLWLLTALNTIGIVLVIVGVVLLLVGGVGYSRGGGHW